MSSQSSPAVALSVLETVAVVLPFCAFVAAVGAVVPLIPEIQIHYFESLSDCSSTPEGTQATCSARASFANSLAQSLYNILVFALSPAYGEASDRHGRKVLLLAGMAARLLPAISLCAFPDDLRPFYAATVLSGAAPAPDSMFFAMVADVVPAADRLMYFGLSAAGFLASFSVGTGLSSLGQPALGPNGIVRAGVFISVVSGVLFSWVLPETAPAGGAGGGQGDIVRQKSMLQILGAGGGNSSHDLLLRSAGWIGLLSFLPQDGVVAISPYYAKHRLDLSGQETSRLVAQMLCIGGVGSIVWLSFGLRLLGRVCQNQVRVFQVMLLFNLLHLLVYAGMSNRGIFLANALLMGAPLSQPAILRAMVSQALPAGRQGRGSGLITSVAGAASAVAPLLFGSLFLLGSGHHVSCLPFLAGALLALVSLLLSSRWLLPLALGRGALSGSLLS